MPPGQSDAAATVKGQASPEGPGGSSCEGGLRAPGDPGGPRGLGVPRSPLCLVGPEDLSRPDGQEEPWCSGGLRSPGGSVVSEVHGVQEV